MKKGIRNLLITAVILVVLFFIAKRYYYLIGHSDPDFNTVFAPDYNEETFKYSKLIGKTAAELIQLEGEPLQKSTRSFLHVVLYTEDKDAFFASRDNDCVAYQGHKSDLKFRRFYFNELGIINNANQYGYSDSNLIQFGVSQADVAHHLGAPADEIIVPDESEVWSYSQLTNGVQSGKTSTIHERLVILNKNHRVIDVIKRTTDLFMGGIKCKN